VRGGAYCRAARYHICLHSPKISDPRFNGRGCEVLNSCHPKSEIATLHGSVSSLDDLARAADLAEATDSKGKTGDKDILALDWF
jgi:hypothetical protein